MTRAEMNNVLYSLKNRRDLRVFMNPHRIFVRQVSTERCEDADLIRSCFGDCVSETVGPSCRWNPELSCPMSGCDEEQVSLSYESSLIGKYISMIDVTMLVAG